MLMCLAADVLRHRDSLDCLLKLSAHRVTDAASSFVENA